MLQKMTTNLFVFKGALKGFTHRDQFIHTQLVKIDVQYNIFCGSRGSIQNSKQDPTVYNHASSPNILLVALCTSIFFLLAVFFTATATCC